MSDTSETNQMSPLAIFILIFCTYTEGSNRWRNTSNSRFSFTDTRNAYSYENRTRWPSIATILYGDHWCSGSLIRTKWVLTSASCARLWTYDQYGLQVHELIVNMGGDSMLNLSGVNIGVDIVLTHPLYDPFGVLNDIALIKLAEPAIRTRSIQFAKIDLEVARRRNIGPLKMLNLENQIEINTKETNHKKCANSYRKIYNMDYPPYLMCIINSNADPIISEPEIGTPVVSGGEQIGIVAGYPTEEPLFERFIVRVDYFARWISSHIEEGISHKQVNKIDHTNNMNAWYSLVSIFYKNIERCSGAIIKPRWVMTSYFCIDYPYGTTHNVDQWTVEKPIRKIERHDYSAVSKIYAPRKEKHIDRRPGYFHYDIALLDLADPIDLETWERLYFPAKLPKSPLFEGTTCMAARHFSPSSPRRKRDAEITLWSKRQSKHILVRKLVVAPLKQCQFQQTERREIFGSESSKESEIDDSWLCMKLLAKADTWKKCLADRGSILLCNGVLCGIASWGAGCVAPGRLELWTRLDRHLSWVSEIIDGRRSYHEFGTEIALGSFHKWRIMVSLRSGGNKHQCAGVLVRHNLVLASASCLEKRLEEDVLQGISVAWGLDDVMKPTDEAKSMRLDLLQVKVHNKYSSSDWKHDVALFPLPRKIKDAPTAQFGEVPLEEGDRCWTGSWRTKLPAASKTNTLVVLKVRMVQMGQCILYYKHLPTLKELEKWYYCTVPVSQYRDDCLIEQGAALVCNGLVYGWGVRRYGCRENVTLGVPTLWWRLDVGNYIFDYGWGTWWPRTEHTVELGDEPIVLKPDSGSLDPNFDTTSTPQIANTTQVNEHAKVPREANEKDAEDIVEHSRADEKIYQACNLFLYFIVISLLS